MLVPWRVPVGARFVGFSSEGLGWWGPMGIPVTWGHDTFPWKSTGPPCFTSVGGREFISECLLRW